MAILAALLSVVTHYYFRIVNFLGILKHRQEFPFPVLLYGVYDDEENFGVMVFEGNN